VGSYNTVGIVRKLQWTQLPPYRKCGIRKGKCICKCKCKGRGNGKEKDKGKCEGEGEGKAKSKAVPVPNEALSTKTYHLLN
jgi:hypothetical protein